ncbi:MAG: YgiQ family radical SAM protein [Saprospiraceae bacterium]|nr:YgiQ family radical SAM protein [Saprospiraceae bacterium]
MNSTSNLTKEAWLPITRKEVKERGWDELDVILISGDAYVDHPSFGSAVIGRIIEDEGLRVAIVPQPNWKDDLRDFKKMGRPRLFFGVTSGCMDPMVNHYTANKRRRSSDAYTPGGAAGFRPDYATTVYCKILKRLYPDVPVIIGGIEASLRRVTHYDYWSDRLFPTILHESGADLLVYGMGELPLREILRLLGRGVPFSSIRTVHQTAFLQTRAQPAPSNKKWSDLHLASHQQCLRDKKTFAANFKHIEQQSNKVNADRLIQPIGEQLLVINPPFPPMNEQQIDRSFDLPYTRLPHPKYRNRGSIPAYEMIRFSINMHRGCFGGCSFCTISAHQGKFIASRSKESILKEVDKVTTMPDFKGYISDLGGPSANMYKMKGKIQSICDRCVSPSCIHPVVCSNLDTSHRSMTEIYRDVDAHPSVKKAFVGSGIRYDLLVDDYNTQDDNSMDEYLEQVVCHHISGRLKVAPEHTSDATLKVMRKPSFKHFHSFKKKYDHINKKHGLDQPLIPYFISSHPGCKEEDMANLAAETKDMGFKLEQVQGFTPTPMTVATIIYYSGLHPYTLKPVYTARSKKEKKNQHLFFFWYKKENWSQIRQKLQSIDREDLVEKLLGDRKRVQKRHMIMDKKLSKKRHMMRKQRK